MQWLESLIGQITQLFPRIRLVWANEGAVFLRKGEYLYTIGPGMYLCWPWIDEIWKVNVKQQIINLPDQSVLSTDGTMTAGSGAVEYDIVDAKIVLIDLQNFDKSIQNFSMGIISKYIREHECKTTVISEIEKEVLGALRGKQNEWGINVTNFWMTDFGPHKAYRIMSHEKPSALIEDEEYEE